jgi:glycosyltransferase involved in cell wall biosynthesis
MGKPRLQRETPGAQSATLRSGERGDDALAAPGDDPRMQACVKDAATAPEEGAAPAAVRAGKRIMVCAIGLRGMPGVLGGIETHCENLYPRLARLNRDLDIVVLARAPYAQGESTFQGVRVLPIWSVRHKYLETLLHTLVALFYARFVLKPDIVHLHAVGPGFFTPLARLFGFKTLVTHHSPDYLRPKWGPLGRAFLRAGERLAVRFATRVVCVNAAIRDDLAQRFPSAANRLCMIRNGAPAMDLAGRQGADVLGRLGLTPGNYVLAVGRLEATKGFHDLVEAFKRTERSGVKLAIAGAAYQDDKYSRQLTAEASDRIVFTGFRTGAELHALYHNAGLFVHPSYMESFSLAILEALAAGAPALLSDIPANREFGLEEDAYFRVGDVDALAAKLRAGPAAWRRSARAAAVVQENNWDAIARRYADLLHAM